MTCMYCMFTDAYSTTDTLRLVRISGVPLGIFTQLVLYLPMKMKAIYSVFVYISLAIALCSTNVSTFCGNDEQIEDLQRALITQELNVMTLTTINAVQYMSSRFALYLKGIFEEMENSLNTNHIDYRQCSEILENILTANKIVQSTSFGWSLVSMLPVVGLALLPSRLATSVSSMLLIRERLASWQNAGCQYATKRDCNF